MLRERHSSKLIILGLLMVFGLQAAAYAQESVATIKLRDGGEIILNKVATSHIDVPFKDGVLSIPIRLLASIKSATIKNKYQVNLVSGESYERVFEEQFKEEMLEGETDLGSYSVPYRKTEVITFRNKKIPRWSQPDGVVALINGIEVYGLKYRFEHFCPGFCFTFSDFQYLSVADGAVLYRIPFSNIKKVTTDSVLLTDGEILQAAMYVTDKAKYQGEECELVFDTHGLEKELYGETPHGNIAFPVEKITSFLFLHDQDIVSPKMKRQSGKEQGMLEFSSNLSAVLTPVHGSPVAVDQLHVVSIWSSGGYSYKYDKSRKIRAKIAGGGTLDIELSKVDIIKEFRVDERYASGDPITITANVVTRSGKEYPVMIDLAWDRYFGGKSRFGYVRVHPAFLKEIRIK